MIVTLDSRDDLIDLQLSIKKLLASGVISNRDIEILDLYLSGYSDSEISLILSETRRAVNLSRTKVIEVLRNA